MASFSNKYRTHQSTFMKKRNTPIQQSEIARFRQEQALQEQAAQQALYGFASVANHASINARMQRGADYLLTLLEAGKYEEVIQLMETKTWGIEEEGKELYNGF